MSETKPMTAERRKEIDRILVNLPVFMEEPAVRLGFICRELLDEIDRLSAPAPATDSKDWIGEAATDISDIPMIENAMPSLHDEIYHAAKARFAESVENIIRAHLPQPAPIPEDAMTKVIAESMPEISEQEKQRRNFAYGNANISNPNITREMVNREADVTTQVKCHDCGFPYDDPGWIEAVVTDDVWEQIRPDRVRNDVFLARGGGILCINCIAKRCASAGLVGVTVKLTAGPLVTEATSLRQTAAELRGERDKLAAFKAYVHQRMDEAGIPSDPPSKHRDEGCRIGGRLDWMISQRDAALCELGKLKVAAVKTADGKLVKHGDSVFWHGREYVVSIRAERVDRTSGEQGWNHVIHCYSTNERPQDMKQEGVDDGSSTPPPT